MKRSVELQDSLSLANIINACQEYYKQGNTGPSKEDFQVFVESLPENLQKYFIRKGFSKSCKTSLFKRFVLEKSGQSMDRYLADRLSSSEFRLWQAQDQHYQELLTSVN